MKSFITSHGDFSTLEKGINKMQKAFFGFFKKTAVREVFQITASVVATTIVGTTINGLGASVLSKVFANPNDQPDSNPIPSGSKSSRQ